MRQAVSVGLACAALAWLGAGTVGAQDLERGKALHDNHCRMCHDSVAYKRGEKIAKDYAQVRAQVVRWEGNTSLRWTQEDIDNVAAYLATKYYGYSVPGAQK